MTIIVKSSSPPLPPRLPSPQHRRNCGHGTGAIASRSALAPPDRDKSAHCGKPVTRGARSPLGGRGMTETVDGRRMALVAAAQQQWIAALTDLGGRNTLLYYKDRRAGTLDLADAD